MDDFSGLEYDQESVSEDDVVTKTNNLLSQFNLPTKVTSVNDITASLFVVLYESLFSDRLPGIVRQPVTCEDEIHNCQMVIDVLSADVIKDNLSHIRGIDIVEGKVQSINNLIDIFSFLYEYVIKQIESDVQTDTEDEARSDRQDIVAEKSDMFLPESVVDSLDLDRGDTLAHAGQNGATNGCTNAIRVGSNGSLKSASNGEKGNGKVPVAAVRSKTKGIVSSGVIAPSPIRPNVSFSLMGHGTLDSTEELIQEGERLERQYRGGRTQPEASKAAWEEPGIEDQPGKFDFIGVRPVPTMAAPTSQEAPRVTASIPTTSTSHDAFLESALPATTAAAVSGGLSSATPHVSHRYPLQESADRTSNMYATAPVPSRMQDYASPERLRSTVGAVPYHSCQTPEIPYSQRDAPVKGLSSSYADLNTMVQQTAAMTRAALETSPIRRQQDRAILLDITDLSQERHQVPRSEALDLARELNLSSAPRPYPIGDSKDIPFPDKDPRQAGFLQEKSASLVDEKFLARENIPPKTYTIPPNTDYVGPSTQVRAANKRGMDRPSSAQLRSYPQPLQQRQRPGSAINRLTQRFSDALDDIQSTGSEDKMAEVHRQRLQGKERQAKMSSKLEEMGKPTLAGAQRRLETEDGVYDHKHEFLKKLYEEEFDDVVEEVKDLVGKDHRIMKDMEDEYRKLLMVANKAPKKAKPASKPKGYLVPTTKRSKPQKSVKVRQKKSNESVEEKVRERPLEVGEDEELMPILMEEFPHLHLSEHTWHELWRRGINQIENLTRAYEENKRRKSQAQVQLEEAARKHEVLAAIVKKQLEHNQRMRQVKEQKRQQVATNNRLHEKRTQSARARRYYNEYQVRAKSKMLKRRTREELIFKNLFKDGLAIQKERIREVQRYAKEQREKQSKKRQDDIDSLENYYRDQFEMLVGKLVKDREEMASREKAHQKVLEQMKRDLRRKMEKEIIDIQSEMFRDEDDAYFRQLEADRLRQELQMAKYQTRV